MVQEVRSSEEQGIFDFNSQAGVLRILQAVRKSELPLTTQNELRDLIFLYTNSGGDQGMRTALEERLLSNQIKPITVTVSKKNPVEPIFGFAGSRPAPSFSANFTPTSVKNDTPIPSAVAETTPVAEPVPTPEPAPAPLVETAPVATPVVTPPSTPEPVVTPTLVEPVPVPEVKPEPVPVVVTAPVVSNQSGGNHLERIKTIKTEVNRRFGNPVHLVDKDAELGREYMTSLLEAMKQLSAEDGGGNIENAMTRLEAAFARVKDIDKASPEQSDTTTKVAVDTEVQTPSESTTPSAQQKAVIPPRPQARPASTPVPVSTSTPTPKREISSNALNAAQVTEVPEVSEPKTPFITPEPSTTSRPTEFYTPPERGNVAVSSAPAPETDTDTKSEEDSAVNIINIRKVDSVAPTNSPTPPQNPVPVTPVSTPTPYSVSTIGAVTPVSAANAPLRTPNDLPDPKTVSSSGSDNPLYTEEVNSGLDQLLSEWVLFRKSGLFGTGPKGVNHPLFKKLAPINIPLLLAGRFEGATQEIRQSITDYMNGWRYEQGIVYDKGETFELYLRRVIRHIIDLQK